MHTAVHSAGHLLVLSCCKRNTDPRGNKKIPAGTKECMSPPPPEPVFCFESSVGSFFTYSLTAVGDCMAGFKARLPLTPQPVSLPWRFTEDEVRQACEMPEWCWALSTQAVAPAGALLFPSGQHSACAWGMDTLGWK